MTPDPRVIYYLVNGSNFVTGGKKQAYRHVDILNRNGFRAFALHPKKNFRYTWFKNETRVSSLDVAVIKPSDFVVMSEFHDPYALARLPRGIRKVVFNQNAHYTFRHDSFSTPGLDVPYLDKDVVATMVVSEQNRDYLTYVFPRHRFVRVHHGIDPDVFVYTPRKKKQIAFTARKVPKEVAQVLNILNLRGVFRDFGWKRIDDVPEAEVARILKSSLIFLSFAEQEGFSLLNTEAMSCGCVVIGYHANAGREYMSKSFSYPIESGDVLDFTKTVERVTRRYPAHKDELIEMGRKASAYVAREYSLDREEKDVVAFWKMVFGLRSPRVRT